MNEITLKFTVEDTNLILEGLGNMPFKQVYGLIAKIQGQAGTQLREQGAVQDSSDAGINLTQAPNTEDIDNG